jgi:ABC-type transporter Mla subunit MlaD
MERSTLDLWVGLFVVAGFLALTILALKVGNMGSFGGTETYQLSAPFTEYWGTQAARGGKKRRGGRRPRFRHYLR